MPSLPDNEQSCDSHLAALVAINIVTQVLDEAEDILNAANDSGQSWRYVWRQKKGNGEMYETAKHDEIVDIKVDVNGSNNCDISHNNNVIVTSTPQKDIDNVTRPYNDNFIGQGDEDIQMMSTDLRLPSMIISCLFDMSEVEQTETIAIFNNEQVNSESRDLLASSVAKLVESYVNIALNTVCGDIKVAEDESMAGSVERSSASSYSLLTDALSVDSEKGHEKSEEDLNPSTKMVNDKDFKETSEKDIDLYEKTFLTLNRDDDKYLEEHSLPEVKNVTMHEVDLIVNKSSENVASFLEPMNILTKEEEAPVAVEGTYKNSLVKRCRLQGAKLMSRLRSWWWKQRLIGKRKGSRSGICPLSPKARHLAVSLLDHRKLRSPSPTRTTPWKFNTVNEALICSYNTKEYELQINNSDTLERY